MDDPLLAPHDAMARFMAQQTVENFAALRDAVAQSAAYNPVDGAMEKLSTLLQRKDYADAVAFVATLMPNWLTNPGAHQACAYALHKQGDIRAARYETFMADALLSGLMMTGNGTRARPFHVMRTEDEYDVLMHLEKQPKDQDTERVGDRSLDVIQCEDGTQVVFDVTLPLSRLAASSAVNDDADAGGNG